MKRSINSNFTSYVDQLDKAATFAEDMQRLTNKLAEYDPGMARHYESVAVSAIRANIEEAK